MDINAILQRLQAQGITPTPEMLARIQQMGGGQAGGAMRPDMTARHQSIQDWLATRPQGGDMTAMRAWLDTRPQFGGQGGGMGMGMGGQGVGGFGPQMQPGARPAMPGMGISSGGMPAMPPQGQKFGGQMAGGGGKPTPQGRMNTGPSTNMMPFNPRGY